MTGKQQSELEFVDLIAIFWRRRYLFWAIVGTAVVVGIVYCVVTPERYEANAVLRVGLLRPEKPIEEPASLISRLQIENRLWDKDRPYPRVEAVEKYNRDGFERDVKLTVQGYDHAEAAAFLRDKVREIVAAHKEPHAWSVSNETQRVAAAEASIAELEKRKLEIAQRLDRASEQQGFSPFPFERGMVEGHLVELRRQLHEWRYHLRTIEDHPTELRLAPAADPTPVAPRVVLAMVLSLLLGLVVAAVTVLLLEFWHAHADRIRSDFPSAENP